MDKETTMKIRFRLGLLLATIVALLGVASPAMAQGGGGGTTTPGCAYITSWTPGLTTLNGQSVVVLDVGVFNGCVDEGAGAGKMPAVSLTTTDTATGKWLSASVIMASYGQRTYSFTLGAPTATPPARTLTLTVTRPNGKVQDSRSATLAEVMQAALATQPAAA
jgi:hypothetical protein